MSSHPVLAEKLSEAVDATASGAWTRRDARLPAVPGKAHAVIGNRRAGKTIFLRQSLAERRAELPPEQALYLSFDDDRLGELPLDQLGFLLEEYYPRKFYPADPGLIQAFDASGRSQIGHALETAVFHELDRRRAEIAYVKCGDALEVDFLARFPDGTTELIQVCADLADPATRARCLPESCLNVSRETWCLPLVVGRGTLN